MKIKLGVLFILAFVIKINDAVQDHIGSIGSHPTIIFEDTPCNDTNDIISTFLPGLSDGYKVKINRTLNKGTAIKLKFDMEALITVGYFQRYPSGAEKRPDVPDLFCGKRKAFNQLIISGAISKPGDWPWHVAIFRVEAATLKYICGGTLISNKFVLTAAHCVTINDSPVLPESLGINLGKHNLIGGDVTSQEREVYEVIVHEDFVHKKLNNDIALLKMKTAVEFNSNIQPACIWFDEAKEKITSGKVFGTVAGWGFDQTESLSTVLREATMPMISDIDCIRTKPLFYSTILDGTKFCAGHRNGTSACNGDSGGGFFIYVPYNDSPFIEYYVKGAWYVRGIVSLSVTKQSEKSAVSLCDPNEYVVFTDVTAYTDWIYDHMD